MSNRFDAGSQAAMEAVEAWANVVTARRLLDISESALARLEDIAGQIDERSSAGAGSNVDALTARSRVENGREAVVTARTNVTRAEAVFAAVFGHKPGRGIGLPPRAPAPPAEGAVGSPVLLRAEAELAAARAALAVAEAGRVPPVSAQVTAVGPDWDVDGAPVSNYLLAPSRSVRTRIAIAQARVQAQEAELRQVRKELDRQLLIQRAEIGAAGQHVEVARRAAEANRQNREAAHDQFRIGRRSLVELLDVEREALAAEERLITAEHDRVLLGYAALAVTGDLMDAFGVALPSPQPEQNS